jgi:hypothetical protein
VAAWLGGTGQQQREPQHPSVDGDVVNFDAALGEQLLDVAVGQAEAQVPADRQHDDIGREAEAGEGGAGDGTGRRRVLMPTVSLLEGAHRECNSAPRRAVVTS